MDELVVTGSHIPRSNSQAGLLISTISREEINALPARTVSELLETVGGLDVRNRGSGGLQSDISVRGSTFEQVLILIDGINLSDAQTGHHNMDLPVNLNDVERIEILKGPGARIYGHNAMSGVINIITRSPDRAEFKGRISGGSHNYYQIQASVGGRYNSLSNRLSGSRTASDGHISDKPTDFRINTFSYKGELQTANHFLQLGLGLTDKNFGAYKFYSDTYPDQRENTQIFLAYAKDEFSLHSVDILANLFWRRHKDEYKIQIHDSWNTNAHRSNSTGFQVYSRFDFLAGTSAVGGETALEKLDSSSLGNHYRLRNGMFVEHEIDLAGHFQLAFGFSALKYSDWGWQYWPGANINVKILKGWNLFSSMGKSYRAPTYTELYYDTPANKGNPDLKPEKAWTYEAGIRYHQKGLRTRVSIFLQNSKDMIDWTRTLPDDPWQARNTAKIKTRGYEMEVEIYPGYLTHHLKQTSLNLSYTYVDMDKATHEFESRYVFNHLKHQAKACWTVNGWKNLSHSLILRYEKRIHDDPYTVVDSRLTMDSGAFNYFLDVRNLFDENYISNGFAPDPGRWLFLGVSYQIPSSG